MSRLHGTHACYVLGEGPGFTGGCRCDPCRAANSAYERERSRRIEPAYVGAAETRAHVRELMAAGVGLKTIAKASRVSHGALAKLIYGDSARGRGPSKRIRPATRDRLLTVTPADAADGASIGAERTWRHIDTLVARGWTKTAIARAIGQQVGGLQLSRNKVSAANARKVQALLDQPVPARRDRHGNTTESTWDPKSEERTRLRRSAEAEARAGYRALAKVEANDQPIDYELPTLAVGAGSWTRRAACRRPEVPTWLFFPGRGDAETVERAKAVCATCPVAAQCLEVALANDEPGVWGGTTGRERDRMAGRRVAS